MQYKFSNILAYVLIGISMCLLTTMQFSSDFDPMLEIFIYVLLLAMLICGAFILKYVK